MEFQNKIELVSTALKNYQKGGDPRHEGTEAINAFADLVQERKVLHESYVKQVRELGMERHTLKGVIERYQVYERLGSEKITELEDQLSAVESARASLMSRIVDLQKELGTAQKDCDALLALNEALRESEKEIKEKNHELVRYNDELGQLNAKQAEEIGNLRDALRFGGRWSETPETKLGLLEKRVTAIEEKMKRCPTMKK